MARRKGNQTTVSVNRANNRPPAGRLRKPDAPAAESNATIDAMSLTTVEAAMNTPIRNGATYRCSKFRTIVISPPLEKFLAEDITSDPCGKTLARQSSLLELRACLGMHPPPRPTTNNTWAQPVVARECGQRASGSHLESPPRHRSFT
jgi:hypothetical protein